MMIIDIHTHTGTMLGFTMTEEMLLESMNKYGIDVSISSNGEAAEFDHKHNPIPHKLQKSQEAAYAESIAFARKNPGKIKVMPWVKPHTQGVTEEFEKMLCKNLDVTAGIKVHPFHSNIPFDSMQVEQYIKLAQKYALPVLTHTGSSDEDCCRRVFNMAEKYPDVKFIMGHMGLGTDNKEAIELMERQPNLYGDTAWVPVETTIEAIKRCGSERMLFGSDNTIDGVDTYDHNPKGEPSLYRQYFGELKSILSKDAYEKLMYKNAVKLFCL